MAILASIWEPTLAMVDPTLCTVDVVHSMDDVIGLSNGIADTAVDCAVGTGMNEMSCAADLTGVLGSVLDISGLVGDMCLVCGDLDETCAVQIMGGIEIMTGLAATLIAAASDCESDPFLCTYDVVSAVDVVNGFAWNIIGAVKVCGNPAVNEVNSQFDFTAPGQMGDILDRYAYLEFQGQRNWADFQRRLQEAIVDGRKVGDAAMETTAPKRSHRRQVTAGARAAGNTTAVASRADVASKFEEARTLHTQLTAQLAHIRSALKARGVKEIPLPTSLLAQPQAESVFV